MPDAQPRPVAPPVTRVPSAPSEPRRGSWRATLALVAASSALSLLAVELAGRAIGFDFAFQERAFERTPIFYRQPVVPVGSVFFRRPGPDRWRGRVLDAAMQRAGVPPELRPVEAEVAITYDAQGFRNPDDLRDWEVVVAGDSFTELGYLLYEDLFTSVAARRLGARVKNLGVSYTGPLTQAFYLRRFGSAPSARHAVLAFFEGNDLGDLAREARALAVWRQQRRKRGKQPARQPLLERIEPQASFAVALWRLVAHDRAQPPVHLGNAWFAAGGPPTPVTLFYAPPGSEDLDETARGLLGDALERWAATARSLRMEPWLLYLPDKRRVLHPHLRFRAEAPAAIANWEPTDLPAFVRSLAGARGIGVIDPSPALAAELAAGRLPFNTIWDTHLSRRGAQVVGIALADALAPALSRPDEVAERPPG